MNIFLALSPGHHRHQSDGGSEPPSSSVSDSSDIVMLSSMSSTGLGSSAGSGRLFPPLGGTGGLLNGTCTLLDACIGWAIGLLLGAGSLEGFFDFLLGGPSSSSIAFLLASTSFCLELVAPLFLPLIAAFFAAW